MPKYFTRRQFVAATTVLTGGALVAAKSASADADNAPSKPFVIGLNIGTIRGYKLSLPDQIEVTAKAGYGAIEPWIGDISSFVDQGGSLKDVRKRIDDAGLKVSSAIDFSQWAVDDETARTAGLEKMKQAMGLVAELGGTHIAAAPSGINRTPGMDLFAIAERYRAVLELGDEMGVVPQLEFWGSAQTLGRVGEAALVAMHAGHPKACLLLDAYHMYKANCPFEGLRQLNGAQMVNFHINDYPADPPREQINDSDRVFPGDGICPLAEVLQLLRQIGFRGVLSLEIFNRSYWEKYDALTTARLGREKTAAVVQAAFG
ncbi:MAG: sugar phosphate isomerase/epimerase [Planctomycetaceae bacterium]|nr:sugar phosphate isomerase/epimerase [Planctomycetaceae bacterium]